MHKYRTYIGLQASGLEPFLLVKSVINDFLRGAI